MGVQLQEGWLRCKTASALALAILLVLLFAGAGALWLCILRVELGSWTAALALLAADDQDGHFWCFIVALHCGGMLASTTAIRTWKTLVVALGLLSPESIQIVLTAPARSA